MRQYVRLFEYGIADYTQDQARDLSVDLFGQQETRRIFATQRYYSQDIGELLGLPIWRKWHMPFGWSEDKTARIYSVNYRAFNTAGNRHDKNTYLERITAINDELIKLNPDLQEIQQYRKNMYDVVFGAVSRFNLDDMKFYMSFRNKGQLPAKTSMSDPEYRDMTERIEYLLRRLLPHATTSYGREMQRLNWVASPETMRKILTKLEQIQKQRANI